MNTARWLTPTPTPHSEPVPPPLPLQLPLPLPLPLPLARTRPLTEAALDESATVVDICVPAGCAVWAQQLQDLGFMPGERVTLLARGRSAASPLVVRVGLSTYALRSAEAACVRVN